MFKVRRGEPVARAVNKRAKWTRMEDSAGNLRVFASWHVSKYGGDFGIGISDSGFRIRALSNLDAGISDSGGLREGWRMMRRTHARSEHAWKIFRETCAFLRIDK